MNRKTFLRLVPLLVIAALAVGAVGAQAAPRILQNGTEAKLEGGKLLPIVMWGSLTLEVRANLGLVKCKYAAEPVQPAPAELPPMPEKAPEKSEQPIAAVAPPAPAPAVFETPAPSRQDRKVVLKGFAGRSVPEKA